MSHSHHGPHTSHHPAADRGGPNGTSQQTYGFVKCKISGNIRVQEKQLPHEVQYHLHADLTVDGSQTPWDMAVNVGTSDADDLLNYRLATDFHHPIIDTLKAFPPGFTDLTGKHALPALDFLRTDILKETGSWRQSDVMLDPDTANPCAYLRKLFERANATNAIVYIFGRRYTDGDGIHDVHMNQGSGPGHEHADGDGNDVWQDGAVLFDFGMPQWVGYFTTFTQQNVPTDDVGDPVDGSHAIADGDEGSMAGQ
jgi:uncharacterized protein YukJ